jgi:hypothetical protein
MGMKKDKVWCDFCGKFVHSALICHGSTSSICRACAEEALHIINDKILENTARQVSQAGFRPNGKRK